MVQRGDASAPRGRTVTDLRLLLFGSGTFAIPSFVAMAAANGIDIVGVITTAPHRAGRTGLLRRTPVALWAEGAHLPLLEVERIRDSAVVARIAALNTDIGLLADFGQIVPSALLLAPRHGILNLHPSLLPRHRGASPIPAAILSGDTETGVSTIAMDAGLDTGALVRVDRVELSGDERAPVLEERLAHLAAEGIEETLRGWAEGRIAAKPQGSVGASHAPRLRRLDGRIGASTTARRAWAAWRAYQPWPGIYVEIPGVLERLRLDQIGPPLPASDRANGSLSLDSYGRLLLHLPGGALPLHRVTPAGGREMDGAALVRGRPEIVEAHARIAP